MGDRTVKNGCANSNTALVVTVTACGSAATSGVNHTTQSLNKAVVCVQKNTFGWII